MAGRERPGWEDGSTMDIERPSVDESAPEPLLAWAGAVIGSDAHWISVLANLTAVVFQHWTEVNWVGFYLLDGARGDLLLGPFQGAVACDRIRLGQGVVGTAARDRRSVVVPNVHQFVGHIACDPRSRSELVVPCFDRDDRLCAVWDVDSPATDRFGSDEEQFLTQVSEQMRGFWSSVVLGG